MLEKKKVKYVYREYTKEPFTKPELESILKKLKLEPKDIFRKNDPVAKQLGLSGNEAKGRLIKLMVKNPTLVQRPIGVNGRKAAVGRPVENLLEIV